ncbi:hypothetical protein ETD83_19830 [Actinomadura soli]|uniref:Uncharacterized protein n=1 Tax=Actinomadura soli TaxID=2508997 RepID=A0A5C4JAQ5_9ACTN|nr:hypothetical protein [Actinomadura soli]TMQ97798.1 hypothetical protein ETD83_19830 [Actinomadura soli]
MSVGYEPWEPEVLQSARDALRRAEGRRARWGYGLLGAGWLALAMATVTAFTLDVPANTMVAVAVAACAVGGVCVGIGCWVVLGSVNKRWVGGGFLAIVLTTPMALLLASAMVDARTEQEPCKVASVSVETRDAYYRHYHYQTACPTGTYKVVDGPSGRGAEPSRKYARGEFVRVSHDRATDERRIIDGTSSIPGKTLFSVGSALMAALTALVLFLRHRHVRDN